MARRRRAPGPPASSPAPTRRSRAAGSTARTSTTPSPPSPGAPGARQAAALLQPPGLRGAGRRRGAGRAGRAARRRPRRRPPGLRHPLDPDRDERHAAGPTAAPTSPSTSTSPPRSPRGSPRRPGRRTRTTSSTARGPGRRRCRGSSRTSTTTSRRWPPTACRPSCWCPIGFVSDHMEVVYDLDTEALATAERLGLPRSGARPPPGPTRGSSRWSATCWSSAPPSSAARTVARASVGALGPLWDRCPVGCCPNPRGDRPALCGEAS